MNFILFSPLTNLSNENKLFELSLNSVFFCQIDSKPVMHGSTWNWWLFEAQVVQKAEWPTWESIRLIILGSRFNSHQSFGQWLKCLDNLSNLTNLLGHNLGKTQLQIIITLSSSKNAYFFGTYASNRCSTIYQISKNWIWCWFDFLKFRMFPKTLSNFHLFSFNLMWNHSYK